MITPLSFLSLCLWATLKGNSVQSVCTAVENLLIFPEEEQPHVLLESPTMQWQTWSLLKLSSAAGALKPACKILQLLVFLRTKHHFQGAFWSLVPAAAMTVALVLRAVRRWGFFSQSFYSHSMNFHYIVLFKIALADGMVQSFEHKSGTKEP